MQKLIAVSQPFFGEEEIEAVVHALRRGEISGNFGSTIAEFEKTFASYCGSKYAVAVSSGTAALHLAVAAAGIGDGDEVLVSASTNVATALAAYHNGAISIPVDSESSTWNMNVDLIESLLTPRVRAIIPVHLYGHPVDMDRLLHLTRKHNLIVIEDCAQSHGATCRGKKTGSFGDMGCFSFYANKIITTGEGGMVTTDDLETANKIRSLRNLAFGNPRFVHFEAGYNFRMTGFQAAMGCVQLSKIEEIIRRKREIAALYHAKLEDVPGLILPSEAEWARHVYWMFAMEISAEFGTSRDELARYLLDNGIESRTFFCPINQQPFLKQKEKVRAVDCPVADRLWRTGLYLPTGASLGESEVELVCRTIRSVHKNCRR